MDRTDAAPILRSSLELHNPSGAPLGNPGDAAGTGASPIQRLKLPQRKLHLHMWGETSSTNSSRFPFSPPCASKVFICPLLMGKRVRKGHSLSHPASRCCSGREFLTALVGSMPGVRVCSLLPWVIPAGQAAVGSSTPQPTAASQPCHRATLHPGSIRAQAVPGLRALAMIQQQEMLDNRLSPQQSSSSCFHKPQEQL